MEVSDQHRERGRIVGVDAGEDDHGLLSCYVTIEFPGGGSQAFGGVILDTKSKDCWFSDLFYLFACGAAVMTWAPNEAPKFYGVVEQLIGQEVFALRSWNDYASDRIVGLESVVTGRVMTVEGWRRRYGLKPSGTPLDERRAQIVSDIKNNERIIRDRKAELETLADGYVHWDEKDMERDKD